MGSYRKAEAIAVPDMEQLHALRGAAEEETGGMEGEGEGEEKEEETAAGAGNEERAAAVEEESA